MDYVILINLKSFLKYKIVSNFSSLNSESLKKKKLIKKNICCSSRNCCSSTILATQNFSLQLLIFGINRKRISHECRMRSIFLEKFFFLLQFFLISLLFFDSTIFFLIYFDRISDDSVGAVDHTR